MLTFTDLACAKGEQLLFRRVNCQAEAGTWLHVAGVNGVGKTSLLRILCGLTPAAAGQVRWRGQPIAELGDAFRRELLYIGHDSGLQPLLSARENLGFSSLLAGDRPSTDDIDDALARFGLATRRDLPTRVLSQGQKRRAALARLWLSRVPLWVLDEPFVAMDSAAVESLNGLLAEHIDRGGLVVLTSHQAVDFGGRPGQVLELSR